LAGEGLPFSFESFMLIGRVPGLAALLNGGQWTPTAAQPSRAVTGEMPLEDMVVRFVSEHRWSAQSGWRVSAYGLARTEH
jgi:hypothetical protein